MQKKSYKSNYVPKRTTSMRQEAKDPISKAYQSNGRRRILLFFSSVLFFFYVLLVRPLI